MFINVDASVLFWEKLYLVQHTQQLSFLTWFMSETRVRATIMSSVSFTMLACNS